MDGQNENQGSRVLKIDLHLHTAEDPVDVIRHDAYALLDRAAGLGYGALAITLHDHQLADRRVAWSNPVRL